jgi:hypothetical protein
LNHLILALCWKLGESGESESGEFSTQCHDYDGRIQFCTAANGCEYNAQRGRCIQLHVASGTTGSGDYEDNGYTSHRTPITTAEGPPHSEVSAETIPVFNEIPWYCTKVLQLTLDMCKRSSRPNSNFGNGGRFGAEGGGSIGAPDSSASEADASSDQNDAPGKTTVNERKSNQSAIAVIVVAILAIGSLVVYVMMLKRKRGYLFPSLHLNDAPEGDMNTLYFSTGAFRNPPTRADSSISVFGEFTEAKM